MCCPTSSEKDVLLKIGSRSSTTYPFCGAIHMIAGCCRWRTCMHVVQRHSPVPLCALLQKNCWSACVSSAWTNCLLPTHNCVGTDVMTVDCICIFSLLPKIQNVLFPPLVLSVLRSKMYRRMRSTAVFRSPLRIRPSDFAKATPDRSTGPAQASSFDTISLTRNHSG